MVKWEKWIYKACRFAFIKKIIKTIKLKNMKKLIFVSAMMFGFLSFSFAQTKDAIAAKPGQEKKESIKSATKPAAKTATPPMASKSAVKQRVAATEKAPVTAEKTTGKSGTVLKKDGTPDKRYIAKSKVTLKKDGTPDKRFSENKKH